MEKEEKQKIDEELLEKVSGAGEILGYEVIEGTTSDGTVQINTYTNWEVIPTIGGK